MLDTQELSPDERIQRNVLDALHVDPEVPSTAVGIEVDKGIVTMTGTVESYHTKSRAAEAALRVGGVRGVANEITVRLPTNEMVSDAQIAAAIAHALEVAATIPHERVKVAIDHGHVLLEGAVDWEYQLQAVHEIVRRVKGVTGVSDLLRIEMRDSSRAASDRFKTLMGRAMERSAEMRARHDRLKRRTRTQ